MSFLKHFFFAIFCLNTALASNEASFSQLAKTSLVNHYGQLMMDLQDFSLETDWTQTKKIRKDIGNVKLLLDIFVHVIPSHGLSRGDAWMTLRDKLDEGYEVFGNYKDVYDTAQALEREINEEEAQRLGPIALKWTRKFLDFHEDEQVDFYFQTINDTFYNRSKKDLPKYIWRRVKVRPTFSLSGLENLNVLIKELKKLGHQDLQTLYQIKDLTIYQNEETFHDWRKGLRNTLKVISFFPEIRQYFNNRDPQLNILDEGIDRFGNINDLLVAFHKSKRNSEKKKIKEQIESQWLDLVFWLQQNQMDKVLTELYQDSL